MKHDTMLDDNRLIPMCPKLQFSIFNQLPASNCPETALPALPWKPCPGPPLRLPRPALAGGLAEHPLRRGQSPRKWCGVEEMHRTVVGKREAVAPDFEQEHDDTPAAPRERLAASATQSILIYVLLASYS